MSKFSFPSGPWVGFYTYPSRQKKYLMDLNLEFTNGVITGNGADGLATFRITGKYSEATGECTWHKVYGPPREDVFYRGFREGKGIWGSWDLPKLTGGFHIWPLNHGGETKEMEAYTADEEVETLHVPIEF
jgi:hypothetical protein